MRPLSAAEAITPAIERAKAILRPFSLKLWIKLGFVALLAELSGQVFFPPLGGSSNVHNNNLAATGIGYAGTSGIGAVTGAVTLVAVLIFGFVFFLIGLLIFYFGSRMQLVLMDLVATRTTLVAPAWHRTATRTWRWIGLKFISFLAFFLIMAIIFAAPLLVLIRSLSRHAAQPPQAVLAGGFALFFLTIVPIILVMVAILWLLRDFVLPFILFEDARLGPAIDNAFAIFRNEPGSVLFYLFMKFVLGIIGGIAAELAIAIALFVAAIPFGIVGGILWFALHHAGALGTAIMYISFALLCAIFIVAAIILVLCVAGAVLIFYQAYALYFLGGRYPRLGALLEPPPPAQQYPPPLPNAPPAPAF